MASAVSSIRLKIREGDVLGGRYRVDGVVGSGGMGVVLSAHQLDLERRVAVKVLGPEVGEVAGAIERLGREARALSRLTSSHVSRLLDVGTLDSGAPFFVMEYLEGQDLADELRQRGPLPIASTVDLVLQACEALDEAHAAGIVHRDIKPANLFLARSGGGHTELKILDFGISKWTAPPGTESTDKSLTNAAQVLGSPLYMSPEQLRSTRDVDARTDVWSLGVVLHELLCGAAPFNGDSFADICARILLMPAPSLTASGIPEELSNIVLRCLEKDPACRWPSIAELASALSTFARHDDGSAPVEPVATPSAPAPIASVKEVDPFILEHAPVRSRGHRRFALLALAAVAVFGALFIGWSGTFRSGTAPAVALTGFAEVGELPSASPPASTSTTIHAAPEAPITASEAVAPMSASFGRRAPARSAMPKSMAANAEPDLGY